MRIVVAQMSHETNTFSPVRTDLARFCRAGGDGPVKGDAALAAFKGTGTCMGGYLDVCARLRADVTIPVAGGAPPSGPVEDEAYEHMVSAIVDAAAAGCDAMMLDLHGAMVTQSHEDGEGELLRRIRAVAPDVPIALALDMHANIYPDIPGLCTVLCGYHTYPHIDMYETAVRAATLLGQTLKGELNPVTVWGNAPMLPHVMRQGTDDFPNKALQERAAQMETEGALAVSLFTGFPHADIAEAGLSVVVVTDGDETLAEQLRDELLDSAWNDRQQFVYQLEPLEASVSRAAAFADAEPVESSASATGPILLLDHYDNTASGGTMDTTEVLAEILRQGLDDVAVFGFFDPEVVQQMAAAGVGAEVTVELGGKQPMPALKRQSRPLRLTGRVKLISDGRFKATVAMSRGLTLEMGTAAVLSISSVDIVIVSKHIEPFDPGCFRSLGIEPTAKRFVMLKSRIHYRVGFRDIAREVVECAGLGVCTSDYDEVEFKKVRRPIFPLDGVNAR